MPRVQLPVGKQSAALTLTATNAGRRSNPLTAVADQNSAFTGAWLQFQKAVPSGASWTPGAALTENELSATVSTVALMGNNTLIGSSGPGAILSDGRMSVNYHTVLGDLLPMARGASVPHTIRFTVTPGALQSGTTRFYVRLLSMTGTPLDGLATPTPGVGWPAYITGTQPVLVEFIPDYTPLQAWRVNHFGAPDSTGPAANDADYDEDGVPNLEEYITGTNPAAAESALNNANALTMLPFASNSSALRLRFLTGNVAMTDPKVRVTVQVSSDLTGWASLASRTGGGSSTGLLPQSPVIGNYTNHLFTTTYTPDNTTRLFARLLVEELP